MCFSMAIKKCNNSLVSLGNSTPGLPFRVAGPQGERLPSAGARTPCPKAKARAGSNTRHGLPRSTCTPLQCRQAGSVPQSGHSLFAISSPRASPSSIQMHGCPRKRAAFSASEGISKSATIAQYALRGTPLPGYPFGWPAPRANASQCWSPNTCARRRRRVPAPTPGTVSPTALARRAHRSLQMTGRGVSTIVSMTEITCSGQVHALLSLRRRGIRDMHHVAPVLCHPLSTLRG